MSTQINFKKGSIEMLLLHVLDCRGDCYGYQLSQLIKRSSENILDFPVGSLYPALYKMIDNGYISDYRQQAGKRLVRVYYHLEEAGKMRLKELKQEYYATNASIQQVLNCDFSEDKLDE
ncbi:MAG: helix-turn-helix transcriptional regulator [Bacillota bacterium]|nr:helix-turn-helix transcriptional regulator [Bacillota bacterium]